jgi:hypothetical protein
MLSARPSGYIIRQWLDALGPESGALRLPRRLDLRGDCEEHQAALSRSLHGEGPHGEWHRDDLGQLSEVGLPSYIFHRSVSIICSRPFRLEELNLGWAHHTNEMLQVVFATLPTSLKKLNLSGTRELEAMNDDGGCCLGADGGLNGPS